jgi:hypothetical protein
MGETVRRKFDLLHLNECRAAPPLQIDFHI